MYKLSIIGLGTMGSALCRAITSKHVLKKEELLLCLHKNNINKYKKEKYHITLDIKESMSQSEMIVLCVKPQLYDELFSSLKKINYQNKTIISLAPGITIKYLNKLFPKAKIIRVMPTTAMKINKSTTTYATNGLKNKQLSLFKKIFNSVGDLYLVKEKDIDLTIPLSGSMPAFLNIFIDAFITASKKYNIDCQLAYSLITSTIHNYSELLMNNKDKTLKELIDEVCSKKGVTIEGVNALRNGDFYQDIQKCYTACVNKSIKLKK